MREGGLLSEGLDCNFLLVSQTDSQIHSGKVALAESLFGLEQIVEVELVHKVFELTLPLLDVLRVIAVELH